ncbi:MAG TPA: hypothetical protein PLZ45_05155 [Ferruginibacter sp.]|nr:hypothetical protein [Chitinophagaceae bacterium]HRI24038.1 hypothetical protein [Ferruginibacter sp.]
MTSNAKMILGIAILSSIAFTALADRGIGKKSKANVSLNIATSGSLRNSISVNLKSGLKYTGSLLAGQQTDGKTILNNTLLTYKKGNTVYIIPHKQVIAVPEMSQGYTGMKLIIKPH